MPLYQYKCECGKSYEELLQPHQASSEIKCICGKIAQQVFSTFSVKVNHWSPSNVDAEAEFRHLGID